MPAAIIFGIIFLVSGILAIKKKRLGYEDGMRMSPPIKENTAVFFGVVMVLIGTVLIIVGLIPKG
ncbi:MAG: hypothetical protein KAS66_09885 [Candidatus Omnitrophica bacterium]|nr:hypothetical protein [Candidatus Omnitrophota bacterium]